MRETPKEIIKMIESREHHVRDIDLAIHNLFRDPRKEKPYYRFAENQAFKGIKNIIVFDETDFDNNYYFEYIQKRYETESVTILPRYTTSIDAAMRLVKEDVAELSMFYDGVVWRVGLDFNNEVFPCEADSLAEAICGAVLYSMTED